MAVTTTLPILSLALIDLHDPTLIAIADTSTYLTLPTSGQFAFQITPPGCDTINITTFVPGSVNIFKAVDLGIVCEDSECIAIPDGIYDIVYSVNIPVVNQVSPEITSIDKTFIRVDQIKCKYQNAFLKVDLECDCHNDQQKKYKKELQRIDLFISGAVAAANDCDDATASNLYNQANYLLDSICCKFKTPCRPPKNCNCH